MSTKYYACGKSGVYPQTDLTHDEMVEKIHALETAVAALQAAGGEPNKIEKIKLNGTEQTISSKAVNLVIEGLPAVTSENNGKILKVVEGEWALADDAISAPAAES